MAAYPVGTASVSWVDSANVQHVQVFWTDGYTIKNRRFDGSAWTDGNFVAKGGDVSATHWAQGGADHLRVYCTSEDQIAEWCSDDGGNNWYAGAFTLS
jgi:hypothetical protein